VATAGNGGGPGFIAPILAASSRELLSDLGAWAAEFKWDACFTEFRKCFAGFLRVSFPVQ
jgi:hypothetical protein